MKLSWTQVNFLNGELYLGRTKNGEDRFVPMNSRVVEIRRRRYEARVNQWVFPNMKGTGRRTDYLHTFRRVAKAAGLPYGLFTDYGFTMHSTRHTATTRMLRAGADVATVQEVVGHSDRTMTLVYSHASAETKRRAVEGLVRKDEGVEKEP
jgi:integrase